MTAPAGAVNREKREFNKRKFSKRKLAKESLAKENPHAGSACGFSFAYNRGRRSRTLFSGFGDRR